MAGGRQKLRPWLEAKIDSGTIPGLAWVDDRKTMFRIPWKHGGKPDWSPESSRVFMEWAIHTGRYREGIDEPDYATWKTNLRCALHKASDINEVPGMRNLDASDPYKVYELLARKDSNAKQLSAGAAAISAAESDHQYALKIISVGEEVLEATPYQFVDEDMPSAGPDSEILDKEHSLLKVISESLNGASLPSNLKSVDSLDLVRMSITDEPHEEQTESEDMQISGIFTESLEAALQIYDANTEHRMHLTLYYRLAVIVEEEIANPYGMRLYYGSLPTDNDSLLLSEAIPLPAPDGFMVTDKQKTVTNRLLTGMNQGVTINCNDGDIEAKRQCRCCVSFSSSQTEGESHQLARHQTQKIFSYKVFLQQLQAYQEGRRSEQPSVEVCLGIGQSWPYTKEQQNVLISGRVVSKKAQDFLQSTCIPFTSR